MKNQTNWVSHVSIILVIALLCVGHLSAQNVIQGKTIETKMVKSNSSLSIFNFFHLNVKSLNKQIGYFRILKAKNSSQNSPENGNLKSI